MPVAFEQLEGSIIDERYRLIRKIGEGGMATVWEAEHQTLGSSVAVKFLRYGAMQNAQVRERFLREARVAASVRHRNVVEIMDFGVTSDGAPYLVMELLNGEPLASLLARESFLEPAEAIRIISLVLRGIVAVHEEGIVHRDLKPQNIFVVEDVDGRYPKLLDFGVCRITESGEKSITREGTILGTLEYMSPEQARGRKDVDYRTDVYAAGAILYETLTGRLPHESKNPGDLLVKIACDPPARVETYQLGIPPALAEVVHKAIAKDRDERYQSAREMREALYAASRAGGFGNVVSGVVSRIETIEAIEARAARAQTPTLTDGAPATPAPAEPAPATRQTGRVSSTIVLAVAIAAATAALLLL